MMMEEFYALGNRISNAIGESFYPLAAFSVLKRSCLLGVIGLMVGALLAFALALTFSASMAIGCSVGLVFSFFSDRIARYWLLKVLKDPALGPLRVSEIIRDLPSALKKDRALMLSVVNRDGCSIQYADPLLQADEEIALAAVNDNGKAIAFLPEHLKQNPKYISAAVKSNHLAIAVFKEKWDMNVPADREVMETFIRLNPRSMLYVINSLDLERDKACVLNAVLNAQQFVYALLLKLKKLLQLPRDKEIVLAVLDKNPDAIVIIEELLDPKRDEAIIWPVIKRTPRRAIYLKDFFKKEGGEEILLKFLVYAPFIIRWLKDFYQLRGSAQEQAVIRGILEKEPALCEDVLICLCRNKLVDQAACYIPDILKQDPEIIALLNRYQKGQASSTGLEGETPTVPRPR